MINIQKLSILLTLYVCSPFGLLHSQSVSYMWSPRIEGGKISKYAMYTIDFLNATVQDSLFTLEAARFTHAVTTGRFNKITSFEFTPDGSQVYFVEEEGDLYRYSLATDELEFLGDFVDDPGITGTLHTGVYDINYLNDTTLYFSGQTYGKYDIGLNTFTLLHKPTSLAQSFTEEETNITSLYTTKYKDQTLYVGGAINKLGILNHDDPSKNTILHDYGKPILIGTMVSIPFDCDSTAVYAYCNIQSNPIHKIGFFRIDIETGATTYSHDFPDFPYPWTKSLAIVKHYNDFRWEFCQRRIDLDADDSTEEGIDYAEEGRCSLEDVPLSDLDIKIHNAQAIDSITIRSYNGVSVSYDLPEGNYSLREVSGEVHIINSGTTSIADYEGCIRGGGITASDSEVTQVDMEIAVWDNGVSGIPAHARISRVAEVANAGKDKEAKYCTSESVKLSLESLLSEEASSGGGFYDSSWQSLSETDIPLQAGRDTVYYIVEKGQCRDTSELVYTVYERPMLNPIADAKLCYGDVYSVDLSGYAEEVVWSDGETARELTLGGGTYSYSITDENGCVSRDTFEVEISSPVEKDSMTVSVCDGSVYTAGGSSYEAGIYGDTLRNMQGCDSTIQLLKVDNYASMPLAVSGERSLCEGSSIDLSVTSAHSEVWLDGSSATSDLSITSGGIHTVVGEDKHGCRDTLELDITKYALPSIEVMDLLDTVFHSSLELPVNYDGEKLSYTWEPSDPLDCGTCAHPTLTKAEGGVYSIEVVDEHGCSNRETLKITFRSAVIELPTIISNHPMTLENGYFYPKGNVVGDYNVRVYDRWGNEMYRSDRSTINDREGGWHPAGSVSPGVYTYLVKMMIDGDERILTGSVTVVE